jgi:hypothetical protein
MYTFIRTEDNARLVIPNEKLGLGYHPQLHDSQRAKYAEVTVQVPPQPTFVSSSRPPPEVPGSATRSSSPRSTGRRP